MKIAVWSSWINSVVSGEVNIGIEVIKHLKSEGHEILVLSQMKSPSKGFLPEEIPCVFLSQKKYPLFSFETLKANYRFRKEIKKFNPDVILYIGVFWFFILRWFLFGLKNKAKTIVWEHGNFHFLVGKRHFLKIYARKTAAAKADRLVVLTHLDKQFYESNCYCKNTPIVISNFVRDEFLKNISAQKKVTERKKQILFAGRMANVKQVDKLINIWHKINQKRSRERERGMGTAFNR